MQKELSEPILDAELYNEVEIPLESTRRFVTETLPQLGWGKSKREEIVLDIGCGPGAVTVQLILPLFPQVKKIFAVDLETSMIDCARKKNPHPLIEYTVANIEDWATVKQWKGQITKLVSIYCFHWLQDQRKGFQNVYQLLKSGGEAAIILTLQGTYFDAVLEMKKKPKWSNLFKEDVYDCIPESHRTKRDASYYQNMLEEIGFEILHCKEDKKIDVFPSDEKYKNLSTAVCVLLPHVPTDRKEEFINDFFEELLRRDGRDCNGLPIHRGIMMELILRKN